MKRNNVKKTILNSFIKLINKDLVVETLMEDDSLKSVIIERGFADNDFVNNFLLKISDKKLENRVLKHVSSIVQKFDAQLSFSQSGEDLIVDFIFKTIGISMPTYIDIGAFDPMKLSNTAFFYLNGSRGVTVEPNPLNFSRFIENRPEDINLNVGISNNVGEIDYYVFDAPTLNTCSKEESEIFQHEGNHKIIDIIKIKSDTLQNIIKNSCNGVFPDFLSLDAEGADEIVLKAIDYEKNYPKVICLETISFSDKISFSGKNSAVKDMEIINFLLTKDYVVFADTYINTILVRKDCFVN